MDKRDVVNHLAHYTRIESVYKNGASANKDISWFFTTQTTGSRFDMKVTAV